MSDLNGPNTDGDDECSRDPNCWKCLAAIGVVLLAVISVLAWGPWQ